MLRTSALLLCLALATSCGSSSSHARSSPVSGSTAITRAELDAAGSVTAYDAVLRLRPNYLRARGPTSVVNASARTVAAVFVNDAEYGDLDSLKRFQASRVEDIRYYSGPEAVTKFGSTYGAGVVAVKLRSQ